MDEISDRPAFDAEQREMLTREARAYAELTRAQAAGLLSALGEYTCRVGSEGPPLVGSAVDLAIEVLVAHAGLVEAHAGIRRDAGGPTDPLRSAEPVFGPDERDSLSRHKYVAGCEALTTDDLLLLVDTLECYARMAPPVEQIHSPLTLLVRLTHAHEALVAFVDRPFTIDEFAASVRSVLGGGASHLTRPGT